MISWVVFLLVMNNVLLMVCCAGPSSWDNCDWIGSGSSDVTNSRGIQPVYLRCSQGIVRWQYPQGALRVVLRHGMSGENFRACFRMARESRGVHLYFSGPKKLHSMFQTSSPTDYIRCVNSRNGHLALYIEADPIQDPLKKNVAQVNYHLKKMAITKSREGDDCRPCNEDEMLRQYCASDFVVKGTVSNLFHNHKLDRSEITIRATKIYQDSNPPVFKESTQNFENSKSIVKYGVVHRPLTCGTKSGKGDYLFFGKWTLGHPILTCIPRMAEWKRVRRKALKLAINQCQLDL